MTSPSDREVFLNEVREALEQKLTEQGVDTIPGSHMWAIDALLDTTELAQAAIDAMIRHMGPPF